LTDSADQLRAQLAEQTAFIKDLTEEKIKLAPIHQCGDTYAITLVGFSGFTACANEKLAFEQIQHLFGANAFQELLDLSLDLMGDYPRSGYFPALQYYRAVAYEKLGRVSAAIYTFKTLLLDYPTHPQTSAVRTRLARLDLSESKTGLPPETSEPRSRAKDKH
jgi:hypothetical protein